MNARGGTIHLTPYFPPQIDGVGDYAARLCDGLRDAGRPGRVRVAAPDWAPGADTGGVDVVRVARQAPALAAALAEADTVLLHYSGYGYQARGVPLWLARGLAHWRRGGAGRRLAVIFHELWASGPPWRSEFYLRFWQRRLVVRLHRLAAVSVTSTRRMQRMLEAIEPGKTRFQPVPSPLPAVARPGSSLHCGGPVRLAVLGLEATRWRSVTAHEALLRGLHGAGLLAGVDVVGRGATERSAEVAWLRARLPGVPVVPAGNLAGDAAAARLARSDLLLSAYPAALACKSSVLMAGLACGCVPVLREAAAAEPWQVEREFLACDGSPEEVGDLVRRVRGPGLAALAQAGRDWQAVHASWAVVAPQFAALLEEANR